MLIRMLALSLLAPLVLLAACGDDDDNGGSATTRPSGAATTAASGGGTEDVAITAADFSFSPTSISAAAGTKLNIDFTNSGAAEHSFTVGDTDVVEAEGGEDANGEYTVQEGDTEFHCKYHPTQMTGTITTTAASNPDATSGSSGVSFGY